MNSEDPPDVVLVKDPAQKKSRGRPRKDPAPNVKTAPTAKRSKISTRTNMVDRTLSPATLVIARGNFCQEDKAVLPFILSCLQ